jgi:hypothetical protein
MKLLKAEIGELQGEGFDLTLTGFSLDEIGELLDETGGDGIEDAPESKYKEQFARPLFDGRGIMRLLHELMAK